MTLLEKWDHSLPSSRVSTPSHVSSHVSTLSPGEVSPASHVSSPGHISMSSQESFSRALARNADGGLSCSLDPARIVQTDCEFCVHSANPYLQSYSSGNNSWSSYVSTATRKYH